MTYKELVAKLNELRRLPAETEIFEFKEAKNTYDFNRLGEYFSALSNEANLKGRPHAWLIFGIKDKGRTIVGSLFRPDRKDLDSLKGEIARKTTNRITFIFRPGEYPAPWGEGFSPLWSLIPRCLRRGSSLKSMNSTCRKAGCSCWKSRRHRKGYR
jgi:hypothetical protein